MRKCPVCGSDIADDPIELYEISTYASDRLVNTLLVKGTLSDVCNSAWYMQGKHSVRKINDFDAIKQLPNDGFNKESFEFMYKVAGQTRQEIVAELERYFPNYNIFPKGVFLYRLEIKR